MPGSGILADVNVPRTIGLAVAALGALGVGIGVALPWARTSGRWGDDLHLYRPHPDGSVIAALVVLVPVVAVARVAFGKFDWRTPSAAAAVLALTGGAVAVVNAAKVDPAAGVRVGAPLTAVGAFTAALGWALVAASADRSPGLPRPWLIATAAVAALLAADLTVVHWATVGRFVDDGRGSAEAVPAAVGNLAGERWHRSGTSGRVLGVAGTQLFVTEPSGVRAYATATGRPTWHHNRSDLEVRDAVLVDGAVVTVYGASTDLLLVTAYDTTTGAELYSRWYVRKNQRPITLVGAGHLAAISSVGLAWDDVLAFDARSGDVRWRYSPSGDLGRCNLTVVAATSGLLAVAQRCDGGDLADYVLGLSATDGRSRWTWRPPYTAAQPLGRELTIDGVGGGLLVRYGVEESRATVFLGADGVAGTPFKEPDYRQAAAEDAAYYQTTDAGDVAVARSVRGGAQLWRTKLPSLSGWIAEDTALTDRRLYLLLSRVRSGSGSVHVVALDRASGRVIGDHHLSCPTSCSGLSIGADANSVVVTVSGRLVSLA